MLSCSRNESVAVNFGASTFAFDLQVSLLNNVNTTHTALFYISLQTLGWSWHCCVRFDVQVCALRCVPACKTCRTLCLNSNSIVNMTCNALRDGQRCHVTLLPVTKALCRAESNHQGQAAAAAGSTEVHWPVLHHMM